MPTPQEGKELLLERLKNSIEWMEKHDEPMDVVDWRYESGVLITGNNAKLFLELLSSPSQNEIREAVGDVELHKQAIRNAIDLLDAGRATSYVAGTLRQFLALTRLSQKGT